mgnify:CR=1 FL=1
MTGTHEYEALIVGAGGAGLYAALEASRLLLLAGRPLPGILERQRRGDHQDFSETPGAVGLDHHPGGVHVVSVNSSGSRFLIQCVEPPSRNTNLRGDERPIYVLPRSRQHDPDYVRACAETARRQCERLYGGHWITLIKTPPSPAEPTRPATGSTARRKSAASAAPTINTAGPQRNERAPPL